MVNANVLYIISENGGIVFGRCYIRMTASSDGPIAALQVAHTRAHLSDNTNTFNAAHSRQFHLCTVVACTRKQ